VSGFVIIGASYAGVQAALSAREAGYGGPIRLVADEPHLPYQRPPLSKAYLAGNAAPESLMLRGADVFAGKGIDLLLGQRATALDPGAQRITLEKGDRIDFDQLLIATGSRARKLAVDGHARDGVLSLRTLDDAHALRPRLQAAASVVVIGGGFIGLEVASTAAKAGKAVTLIEAAPRLLGRAVAPVISDFLLALHRRHGVDIRLNAGVARIDADGQRPVVVTGEGERLPADLVLVGVGGIANQELAAEAGLACDNGIVVDAIGRTAAPTVFAAGDCSQHANVWAGRRLRLESVQHATDQGRTVGLAVAGQHEPYEAVPRFWSDQYEAKLQMVGLADATDEAVIRGSVEDGRFSVFRFRDGRLTAVESVSRPGDQMLARRLIAARRGPTPAQAADAGFDLKSLDVPA
jgi:3-phenylpropionate/trans-cinnamate dioxygenase ferredoxin reductase subunit